MTIHNEKQLLKQVDELALMLDGELTSLSTSNSSGRTSDKIIIEYNIKEKTTFVTKSVHPEMEEVEVGDDENENQDLRSEKRP